MTKPFGFLVVVALAFSGCVHTKYTLINPSAKSYDTVSPEQVWIVTAESELDNLQYTRIAIIEATGSGEYTDQTGMIDAIRKRAAKLGANSVLLPEIDEPGAGAKIAGALFGTGTQRKGSAIGHPRNWTAGFSNQRSQGPVATACSLARNMVMGLPCRLLARPPSS